MPQTEAERDCWRVWPENVSLYKNTILLSPDIMTFWNALLTIYLTYKFNFWSPDIRKEAVLISIVKILGVVFE